jgi:hypothetical protein
MGISEENCCNMKDDNSRGRKDAYVITVRGILSGWKQISHFNWETYPSKGDVINIISVLQNTSLEVRAITSDMGTRNQGLWKEFEVGKVVRGE